MILVEQTKCTACGVCIPDCPLNAIAIENNSVVILENCVSCGICVRKCKLGALTKGETPTALTCTHCPIQCQIGVGFSGACKRYTNQGGSLIRNRPLVLENPLVNPEEYPIAPPIVTAVGAGTSYPCSRPAPFIMQDNIQGLDVITAVTEAPLSYSGVKIKVDSNFYLDVEGSKIYRDKKVVGLVETEDYGSKMLSIGGANLLTGKDGFIVAKTIVELANKLPVELSFENKTTAILQAGKPPIVNGKEDEKMRVGCGSATIGLFARDFKGVVDEVVVLDHHVIGLFTEHFAGREVGTPYSGVIPNARKSTPGRYFGEHGHGLGGTDIINPAQIIGEIDKTVAKPGAKILVTETTGRQAAVFEIQADFSVLEIETPPEIKRVLEKIQANCEDATVSVFYTGGTGGSARAGVCSEFLALSKAIHAGKVQLTIGGALPYIWSGGGVNFMVNVEKTVDESFTWVPTPATVAPIEFTMSKKQYEDLGGHCSHIKSISQTQKED